MKKIIKNNMLGFILGGLIFGSIGIYAASYLASDISYTRDGNLINVNEALDDLHNKINLGNATAEDIASGKSAVVQGKLITGTNDGGAKIIKLGSGTSFNVSSYEGYQNFTVNNFIVEPINGSVNANSSLWSSGAQSGQGRYSFSGALNLTKSYDSSNGILSSYATISGSASSNLSGTTPASGSKNLSVNAYLIIGTIG